MSHRPITEDDLHAYVDGVLEPEEQDAQFLLGIWPEVQHRALRRADLVAGGAGQTEHDLGR